MAIRCISLNFIKFYAKSRNLKLFSYKLKIYKIFCSIPVFYNLNFSYMIIQIEKYIYKNIKITQKMRIKV